MRYQFIRFPGGKPKALTFSYDDGVRADIRFSELLTKYGMKGTFNLNSFSLRGQNGIQPDEVREYILDKGHEVAVHGFNHRAEGTLRPIEGIREVLDNRLELEKEFGCIIRGMAYPDSGIRFFENGADYASVKHYLTDLGIVYSRTLGGDNDSFNLPTDFHAWMPTAHHNNPEIFNYIDKFLAIDMNDPKIYGSRRRANLFYLWGHSYEFDNNNNWDHIEKICEKLANRDDIWYATNMEIYEYVNAYNSLVYSADGSRIYNPSLQTVWLDSDKTLFTIKPGETIVR